MTCEHERGELMQIVRQTRGLNMLAHELETFGKSRNAEHQRGWPRIFLAPLNIDEVADPTLLVGGAFARDKGNARLLGHGASFSGSARFVIRIINQIRFRPGNLIGK